MMAHAGQIQEDEFILFMEDLYRRSKSISDSWEISKCNQKAYLNKKEVKVCVLNRLKTDMKACEELGCEIEHAGVDPAEVNDFDDKDLLTFEYHIIYSESYSVPVLYFNVYRQDGSLLPLAQVWELVPDYFRERLDSDKWTFLTQSEHPYLGRPFYQLHPCHTDKLMASVSSIDQVCKSGSNNYLIGWLSAVGPVVLLKLPVEYGLTLDDKDF